MTQNFGNGDVHMAHKPSDNHPWKKFKITPSLVNKWAKEKSEQTKVNNFRIGQLGK